MCLVCSKLNEPQWPMVPAMRPLSSLPRNVWAESSMTIRLCCRASSMIGSMSQGRPLMGTGMMALVRAVILRFTSFASMLKVRRSISANTGLPL